MGEQEYGGMIDDIKTALKWKPILPLLQNLSDATLLADQAKAVLPIIDFIVAIGFNDEDVDSKLWRRFVGKIVSLIESDRELRNLIRDLLK